MTRETFAKEMDLAIADTALLASWPLARRGSEDEIWGHGIACAECGGLLILRTTRATLGFQMDPCRCPVMPTGESEPLRPSRNRHPIVILKSES